MNIHDPRIWEDGCLGNQLKRRRYARYARYTKYALYGMLCGLLFMLGEVIFHH